MATGSLKDRAWRAARPWVPEGLVRTLRAARAGLRAGRDQLFAVGLTEFERALAGLGIEPGAMLYVRSSWDDMRTLRASPSEVIEALARAIGPDGTLVMPTYPMTGLAERYLEHHPAFDWRRTPSRSGLLTEVFRRMPGTERSLHPTHPLAARGRRAQWLVDGHERCETDFDEHSPFERLWEADATVLSLGRFEAMTLRHFADHKIRDLIPYPLYSDRTFTVRLVDRRGRTSAMVTRPLNPDLGCDHGRVLGRMHREGFLRRGRVGLIPLLCVRVRPYVEAYRRYYEQGLVRHYLRSSQGPADTGASGLAQGLRASRRGPIP